MLSVNRATIQCSLVVHIQSFPNMSFLKVMLREAKPNSAGADFQKPLNLKFAAPTN